MATEATYELPRADEAVATRGIVECLGEDGCQARHLCREPYQWEHVVAPDDFDPSEYLLYGERLHTPWNDDAAIRCAVHVEGAANVQVVREHREVDSSGEWVAVSRETTEVEVVGSVVGRISGDTDRRGWPYTVAPGWGDCRPATEHSPCPDSTHIYVGCDESLAHAVIFSEHLSSAVQGGEILTFRVATYGGGSDRTNRSAWTAKEGRLEDKHNSRDQYRYVRYRAPWVNVDTDEVVTVSTRIGGHHTCATTSIEFTIEADE